MSAWRAGDVALAGLTVWTACVTAVATAAAQMPQPSVIAIDGPPPPTPPATVARGEDGRVTMRAIRLSEPLTLDGVLDETVYGANPPVSDFAQQYPNSGEPATEQTEVWIFFDSRNVYVGVRCWDSRPDLIVANEMRRDNRNIWLNDNVIVAFDTFYDRRSAVSFQTNPLGGVRDSLIIDENTVNFDWNAVWDVKSRLNENGWSAEMAIPFKSLRYRPTAPQVWGFNVMRMVRSKNEQTLLSPVPRNYGGQGLWKLSSAATLVGIEPPPSSRNIGIKPYAISNLTTDLPSGVTNDLDADFGFDARYALTSSLSADFTYNTDFAQVEIDEQQVNLTRFSLFFPEKRDFFLEGQGVFEFGGSGGRLVGGTQSELPILFFSRRIGLGEGRPVPIQVGGRLLGRLGRTSIGILNLQAEALPAADALATNFTVIRVKQDVLRRSSIGMLATNRTPSLSGIGSNQVFGVDANLAFYENVRVNAYYARSATTEISGDAESYNAQFRYTADRYGFEALQTKAGKAFNPEVGFLRRQDFRRNFVLGRFSPRLDTRRGIRQLTWEASLDRFTNSADVLETRLGRGTFRIDFHSSDLLSVDYTRNYEFLVEPFEVSPGVVVPVGAHDFADLQVAYELGPQRKVSGRLNLIRGGFFTGDRTEVGYTGRVEVSPQVAVEPRAAVNWVDLPEGEFRLTLLGVRPILTISPRMFVSVLVQYNSGIGALETNARWRWEYEPGSDLFVVYTDGRDTTARGYPELVNRGFAVKFTKFLRF